MYDSQEKLNSALDKIENTIVVLNKRTNDNDNQLYSAVPSSLYQIDISKIPQILDELQKLKQNYQQILECIKAAEKLRYMVRCVSFLYQSNIYCVCVFFFRMHN